MAPPSKHMCRRSQIHGISSAISKRSTSLHLEKAGDPFCTYSPPPTAHQICSCTTTLSLSCISTPSLDSHNCPNNPNSPNDFITIIYALAYRAYPLVDVRFSANSRLPKPSKAKYQVVFLAIGPCQFQVLDPRRATLYRPRSSLCRQYRMQKTRVLIFGGVCPRHVPLIQFQASSLLINLYTDRAIFESSKVHHRLSETFFCTLSLKPDSHALYLVQ